MLGGSLQYFLDAVALGEELWFKYKGRVFFYEGYNVDGKPTLFLCQDVPEIREPLWVRAGENNYPWLEFLHMPIWDGHTFMEVQDEIEWIEGV